MLAAGDVLGKRPDIHAKGIADGLEGEEENAFEPANKADHLLVRCMTQVSCLDCLPALHNDDVDMRKTWDAVQAPMCDQGTSNPPD